LNLQHWIDQHPTAFAAIFPIYFLSLWLLIGAIISFIGGWFSLAKVYRTRLPFDGAKWRMQSGQMRWLTNYNNVLTNAWSQPGGFVFGQHVPLSIYAPSAACSVERDQGAQEEGLGVRIRDLRDGTRTGNPFADSREAGGEAQGVGWKLLARGGRLRGKRPYVYVAGGREIDDCTPDMGWGFRNCSVKQ
jgi:hypothetical protein